MAKRSGMDLFPAVVAMNFIFARAVEMHTSEHQLRRERSVSEVSSNQTLSSLQRLGDSCKCSFAGTCSCVQALEFMKCITNACNAGTCDCQLHHHFYACKTFSSECPSVGLKCSVKDATCDKTPPRVTDSILEKVADVASLQEQFCKYDGLLNGKARAAAVEKKITDRSEQLKLKGVEVPELGCGDEDLSRLQEFQEALKSQEMKEHSKRRQPHKVAAAVPHSNTRNLGRMRGHSADVLESQNPQGSPSETAGSHSPPPDSLVWHRGTHWITQLWHISFFERTISCLIFALLNVTLAFVAAHIYLKYLRASRFLAPKPVTPQIWGYENDFKVGLFGCFSDIKLTLFTCCCPCLRWAETAELAGLTKFWWAFSAFVVMAYLAPCTLGLSAMLLSFMCFKHRQRLRKRYIGKPRPIEDCLAHFFCSICAIIQEARVVETEA